ncbi:MAG: hypothetical protein A2046_10580 [Bacteroidetes bacterium GWA2_30_7]|nr:MAG: hypothetical protein A2046_10580 [Bacteroidetes bacterium GWA2_30_7]
MVIEKGQCFINSYRVAKRNNLEIIEGLILIIDNENGAKAMPEPPVRLRFYLSRPYPFRLCLFYKTKKISPNHTLRLHSVSSKKYFKKNPTILWNLIPFFIIFIKIYEYEHIKILFILRNNRLCNVLLLFKIKLKAREKTSKF